jgi:hypothetical protein
MRALHWLRPTSALLLAIAPLGAAAFQPGDLLVSYGHQILQVDPDTGAYSVFSPPPLSADLIGAQGTAEIAIDPMGDIFVVGGGNVVQIDPDSGEQHVLMARDYVCVGPLPLCSYFDSALPLGPSPLGIDSAHDGSLDLFVGCYKDVYRVHRVNGEVSSSEYFYDQYDSVFASLLVASNFGSPYVADHDLHRTGAPPTPVIFPGLGAPASVSAISAAGSTLVVATAEEGDPSAAGVYFGGFEFLPLTQGGYLRRPVGVTVDPLRMDRIWVADAGDSAAPANRLIQLDYDGLNWRQTVFAELPAGDQVHGIAAWPAHVPEPGALDEAIAVLGVLALRRRYVTRCARVSKSCARRIESRTAVSV